MAAAALLSSPLAFSQSSNFLTLVAPPKLAVGAAQTAIAPLKVQLRTGYNVNSHTPREAYLIPLRLSWEAAPLEVALIKYPEPHDEKYEFSEKPLSVFTGDFEIVTVFRVPPDAPKGARIAAGKLRYQACTTTTCFPPRTAEVKLPVEIR